VKGVTIPFKTRLVANCFLTRCTHQTYIVGVLGGTCRNKPKVKLSSGTYEFNYPTSGLTEDFRIKVMGG